MRRHRQSDCLVVRRARADADALRASRESAGLSSSFRIAKSYLRDHDGLDDVPWREAAAAARRLAS